MDASGVAVIIMGVVTTISMATTAYCAVVMSRSASEKRQDFLRAHVVEAQAALAQVPGQLAGAAARPPDPRDEPADPELPTQGKSYRAKKMRADVIACYLDPDSLEDVGVFMDMKERGLDPSDTEAVLYYNRSNEMGDS